MGRALSSQFVLSQCACGAVAIPPAHANIDLYTRWWHQFRERETETPKQSMQRRRESASGKKGKLESRSP